MGCMNVDFSPFEPNDILILALSGGADSVFLGETLFQKKFKKIVIAHFNHELRGEESLRDQRFCRKKAEEWRYVFETASWKHPEKSEEKARTARYEFLESIRKKHDAKAILLAHHTDDQMETILFQFLRGTGVKGLRGMKKWDEERKIFRPLLSISKKEVLQFLHKQNISFHEDSTNADDKVFDRNFLRLKVSPLLKERFPHFKKSLLRNAELFASFDQFLSEVIERILQSFGKDHSSDGIPQEFSREEFFAFPIFLQSEILRTIFAPQTPGSDQIFEILEFLRTARSGKKKSLLNVTFEVYGENIFLNIALED